MKIETRGLITGPIDLLDKLPKAAFKVASWQNGVAVKSRDATYTAIDQCKAYGESVFDAAHGRRYMLFVYADKSQRKACWDHITGAKT